jgi:hypothetical protein
VNQPVLNRLINIGVITQQLSTLDCSKSMIEAHLKLKLESKSFFQKEMLFNVFLSNSFEMRKDSTQYDEFSIFFLKEHDMTIQKKNMHSLNIAII